MVQSKLKTEGYTILVTGGSGFLGKHIVKALLKDTSILPLAAIKVVDLKPLVNMVDKRLTFIQGDIRDKELMLELCKNTDLVIHTAAIVDWGTRPKDEVSSVNHGGTEVVVKACIKNKVKALVHTSTLDVLFDGSAHVEVNESAPYPPSHTNAYCRSKYLGEILVRHADCDSFRTCVIRPSDIFGEGDPYHISSLVNMAKGGFYIRLGKGTAECQPVYVGNLAHAHILAAKELLSGNDKLRGKAYFITDGPSANFFTFFDAIVEGAGYKIWPKNIWLPRWFAYSLGAISEFIAILAKPIKRYNPKLSRYAVIYTCTDYTIKTDKANKDFAYEPIFSREEAIQRSIEFFRK